MGAIVRGKIQRGDMALWDGANKTTSRVDATGGTVTGLTIGDSVDVLQVFGAGTSRTRGTIATATGNIGATNTALLFSTGTWTIDDDLTIPSNFTCLIPAGCVFDVASGKTLTLAGPTSLQNSTWSSGAGTAVITGDWPGVTTGRTSEEVSASVFPTDYRYPALHLMRYGDADPTYSSACGSALQDVINVASYGSSGNNHEIILPSGHFKIDIDVYGEYDAANNSDYNSDNQAQGRWTMRGANRGGRGNVVNDDTQNISCLEFDSGKRFYVANGGANSRSVVMKGVAIWGDISSADTGYLIYFDYCSNVTDIEISVFNRGNGKAVYVADLWSDVRMDLRILGAVVESGASPSTGTGIDFDPTQTASGGNVTWHLSIEGFEYAGNMGVDYNASNKMAYSHEFMTINVDNCENQLHFKHGMIGYTIYRIHGEDNTRGALLFSESTGIDEPSGTPMQYTPIRVLGGSLDDADSTGHAAGASSIQLGTTGNTADEDSHGPVIVDGVLWKFVDTGKYGVLKYNNDNDGPVLIRRPCVHNGGGEFMQIEDASQYGTVTIEDTSCLEMGMGAWVVKSDGTDLRHWVNWSDVAETSIGSLGTTNGGAPDYDYTNANILPNGLYSTVASGNIQTIALPTDAFPFHSWIHLHSAGTMRFDPGASGKVNGGTTAATYDVVGADVLISVRQLYKGSTSPRYHIHASSALPTTVKFQSTTTAATVTPTAATTHVRVTSDANPTSLTLANGKMSGQQVHFYYHAEGAGADTVEVTPTSLLAGGANTKITLTSLEEGCSLIWDEANTGWRPIVTDGAIS